MLEPAYRTGSLWDGQHRELNFKICTAVDLTKVSIVIEQLERIGMLPETGKILKQQAEVLLASILSENNRLQVMNRRTIRAPSGNLTGSPEVCMCGANMEGHSLYDNHSPLSERDYKLAMENKKTPPPNHHLTKSRIMQAPPGTPVGSYARGNTL